MEDEKMDMKLWNFLQRVATIRKTVYVNSEGIGVDENGNQNWRIEIEDENESIEGEYTASQEEIEAIVKEHFNMDEDKTIVDIIYTP